MNEVIKVSFSNVIPAKAGIYIRFPSELGMTKLVFYIILCLLTRQNACLPVLGTRQNDFVGLAGGDGSGWFIAFTIIYN